MIVPSIDLLDGRAVQLRQGKALEIDAGDPRPIAERFALAGEVAVIDLDAARGCGDNREVVRELLEIADCRVGGGIRSTEAALDWLDAGAARVILGTAATPEVLAPLPRDRVIAALDEREGEVVVEGWRRRTGEDVRSRMTRLEGLVGGFLVTFVDVEGTMTGLPLARIEALVRAAGAARLTVAGGVRTAAEIAAADVRGADAQVGMAIYSGALGLADAIAAPLRSERSDGLWPTIVEDVSGTTLGLVWSSAESLRVAVAEGRGVYWSRTRGLWRKGETSGATQELVRIDVDCDRDALRFLVRQRGGGFCHTGAGSCFRSSASLPGGGLAALERRLADRLARPRPGSLTSRLASEPSLLAAKLAEEAQELAEAGTPGAASHELADLLYFGLVRLLSQGGSMSAVERELARRARRVRRRAPRTPAGVGEGSPPVSPPPGDPDRAERAATTAIRRGRPDAVLPRIDPDEAVRRLRRGTSDAEAGRIAAGILADVEREGEAALRRHAERLGDIGPGEALILPAARLEDALDDLDDETADLLDRVADRIRAFARAQMATATDLDTPIDGGRAGHALRPVRVAGGYVPAGRYPLPSSALMTAIPARVAGVDEVWLASPRPGPVLRAAAAVAGVDGLLAVGGAQAIAALAFGVGGLPPADIVVGPGNRFVTAAKRLLYGRVGLDMLAGPSELVVVAAEDADPDRVAADLIAQAEHDPEAIPLLCTTDETLAEAVRGALERRLGDLPTAEIARRSLAGGGAIVIGDIDALPDLADSLAPEHLSLQGRRAVALAGRFRVYGTLFTGDATPEAAGDYGAGPNHTLPTGGTARFASGLSVFTFLRRPTWLELAPSAEACQSVLDDAAALARLEGLEGHARSVEARTARGV